MIFLRACVPLHPAWSWKCHMMNPYMGVGQNLEPWIPCLTSHFDQLRYPGSDLHGCGSWPLELLSPGAVDLSASLFCCFWVVPSPHSLMRIDSVGGSSANRLRAVRNRGRHARRSSRSSRCPSVKTEKATNPTPSEPAYFIPKGIPFGDEIQWYLL